MTTSTTIPIDEVSIVTEPSGNVSVGNVGSGNVSITGLGTNTLSNLLGGLAPIVLAPNSIGTTQPTTDNSTKIATTQFVQSLVTGLPSASKVPVSQEVIPTNTSPTASINANIDIVLVGNSTTITSLTIDLPSMSTNWDMLFIFLGGANAITFTAASGQSVNSIPQPPSAIVAGTKLRLILINNVWYVV